MQKFLIIIYFFVLSYILFQDKKKAFIPLSLATLISFVWVTKSGLFLYKGENYFILGINFYSFIGWITTFMIAFHVYRRLNQNKFLKITILYLFTLLSAEYIGYNFLHIRLDSNFEGLFGFSLLHLPWWGKCYYLTAGPVFVKLLERLPFKKNESII